MISSDVLKTSKTCSSVAKLCRHFVWCWEEGGGSQTCPQHPKFHDVGLLRATPSIHQFSSVLFPAMSTDFCYPLEGSMRLEMNCTRAISFTPDGHFEKEHCDMANFVTDSVKEVEN